MRPMELVRQCWPATIIQPESIKSFMHTHHHDYPTVHMPQVPTRRLLENQTVIVTGASSGIGKSIAIALGAAGANVCVNYVTGPEKAEAVVEEIEKDCGHAFVSKWTFRARQKWRRCSKRLAMNSALSIF